MSFLQRVWRGSPDAPRSRAVAQLYRIVGHSNSPQAQGRRLLRRWLSAKQRAEFDAFGFFEVTGCHTARRYRISDGPTANVEQLDSLGNAVVRLCFVPQCYLVPGDIMLAQKIALETDELGALAVANRFAPAARIPF
jgi:hypothetical protein